MEDKIQNILRKYDQKLAQRYDSILDEPGSGAFSRDYFKFKKQATFVTNTYYERLARLATQLITFSPKKEETKQKLQEAIEVTHLNITPTMAYTLGILSMVFFIALGFLTIFIPFLFAGTFVFPNLEPFSITISQVSLALILILAGVLLLKPISNYPLHLAARHRLRASNQMVLCILYIVIYMRHTPNLEHAIRFAGEHIGNPLALDLRKVYWNVETGRFPNITISLDHYLKQWRDHNLEFVESFNLIKSSLFESSKKRRVELLEKALDVILEGTYQRMLHYAQESKSPITTMHMIGVILPILGLIILPLVGTFLGVKWFHLALLYNLILPVVVYFWGYSILAKRPIGYSQSNIYEENVAYQRLRLLKIGEKYINPLNITIVLVLFIILFATLPFIFHAFNPLADIQIFEGVTFFDYRTIDEIQYGPFGLGMTIFSLLIPLLLALAVGFYFKVRSNKLIKIRERTKKLETEFKGALFQLGNRIGAGLPVELAFGNVAQTLRDTPTGNFFAKVDSNIRRMGMSVQEAIFNKKVGAMLYYPSSLIESSMKVLVESARKGPKIVSAALITISEYLQRINTVSERLKDLLSEVTSSMKAQISFLTPLIAGIVVGIGTMITTIISTLASQVENFSSFGGSSASPLPIPVEGILDFLPLDKVISPFFFQLVVGIYVIEVVYVLTVLGNGIENGVDKLNEENQLGKNLYTSAIFYFVVALITIIIFNLLAMKVGTVS